MTTGTDGPAEPEIDPVDGGDQGTAPSPAAAAGGRPSDVTGSSGESLPPAAMPPARGGKVSVAEAATIRRQPGAPSHTPARRSGRTRERWRAQAVIGAAGLAGAFVEVTPSGTWWADRVMAAGFVAGLAAAGSSAKRWSWAVTAVAAVALADGSVAFACGLAALGLVLASSGPVRPEPAVGAAVGALAGVALLGATDIGFHGSSAILVTIAAAPLVRSGYRLARRSTRQRLRRAASATAVAVVMICALYLVVAASARPSAERGVELLRQGMASARDGDDARATDRLSRAAAAFADADRQLNSWLAAPVRLLPVVGHNARAAGAMASSAAEVARDGTDIAVDTDVDSLTIQGGRLDVERVGELSGPLDGVVDVLSAADADLAAVDDDWLVAPVAEQLDDIRDEVATARPDVELAADATRLVPAIFGGDGASRWLVAFVTPVEARGRTGFMGNFAELTAVDGVVDMTRFGRSSDLEDGGTPSMERVLSGPEDYLTHWGRFHPEAIWRNVTMSPDFPAVGQVMAELYPQSGGQPVDGVIAIDPAGLAALMEFTGPIEVPQVDMPLTAETAAQFLLRDQYLDLNRADRLDALEEVARATFDRLTTGDLPAPREIADVLGPVVRDGHLHVYGSDPEQQGLFSDLGIDGALPAVDGDSLAVVTNNATGNKIDLFLQRTVDYDVRWDPGTGELSATATVTLTNTAPASGLPGYVIGSPESLDRRPPPGTNRTYLSIYSPWQLAGAAVDGTPVEMERQVEAGRHSYSVFLDVPPEGGTRTVTLDLRGQVDPGGYELDVSTQPLTNPDQWNLAVEVVGTEPITVDRPLVADGHRISVSETLTRENTTYRIDADDR